MARRDSPTLMCPYTNRPNSSKLVRLKKEVAKKLFEGHYGSFEDGFLFGKDAPPCPPWYNGSMVVKTSHIFPIELDDRIQEYLGSIEGRYGFKTTRMNIENKDNGVAIEECVGFTQIGSANDVRNLLRLWGPVKEAFDGLYLSFIYDPFDQALVCWVFDKEDKWLMNHCHEKQLQYKNKDKLPSLRLLAIHLEYCFLYWNVDEYTQDLLTNAIQLSLDYSITCYDTCAEEIE